MAKPLSGVVILVVDDEGELTEVIGQHIESKGARVWTAGNGNEALQMIKKLNFDLVLTDVRMPGTDGMQLLLAAKAAMPNPPGFIFMTGYSDFDPEFAKREGVFEVLQKPFDFNILDQLLLKYAKKSA